MRQRAVIGYLVSCTRHDGLQCFDDKIVPAAEIRVGDQLHVMPEGYVVTRMFGDSAGSAGSKPGQQIRKPTAHGIRHRWRQETRPFQQANGVCHVYEEACFHQAGATRTFSSWCQLGILEMRRLPCVLIEKPRLQQAFQMRCMLTLPGEVGRQGENYCCLREADEFQVVVAVAVTLRVYLAVLANVWKPVFGLWIRPPVLRKTAIVVQAPAWRRPGLGGYTENALGYACVRHPGNCIHRSGNRLVPSGVGSLQQGELITSKYRGIRRSSNDFFCLGTFDRIEPL